MSGKASGSRFCWIDQLESWPGRFRFSHFSECSGNGFFIAGPGHCLELGLTQEDAHLKKYKSGISALADRLMTSISSTSYISSSWPVQSQSFGTSISSDSKSSPEVLKSSWLTASFRPCFLYGPSIFGHQCLHVQAWRRHCSFILGSSEADEGHV